MLNCLVHTYVSSRSSLVKPKKKIILAASILVCTQYSANSFFRFENKNYFCCKNISTFVEKNCIINMDQPTSPSRGVFILFEGVDRCGKTTQATLLAEYLKNELNGKAEFIRFPDRTTPIGVMINSYLTNASEMEDHAIHQLFSANRWEAVSSLKMKLEEGTTLVCDRYCYSGVAFSAAKPSLSLDWCMSSDIGLPAPDCVIFLDLPVEKAQERGQFGQERYEKEEMQNKVRENFLKLMTMDEGLIPWHIIDASQTIDAIFAQIKHIALKILEDGQRKPIGLMWEQYVRPFESENCDPPDSKKSKLL